MNSQLISDWLNSKRNFTEGANLFSRMGGSPGKVAFFAKGESALRREMLIEALQALQLKVKEEEKPTAVVLKAIGSVLPDEKYSSAPEEVKALIAQVKQLYKEGQAMKSKLLLIPERFDRAVMAHEIRDIDELSSFLLEQINFYKEFNYLPSKDPMHKKISEMSAAELFRRKNYLEPWISRHKLKNSEKLTEAIAELNEIRKRIDDDCI